MDAKEFLEVTPKTIPDIICEQCQRYQRKYGIAPDIIGVNLTLKDKLRQQLRERDSPICGIVVYFLPLQENMEDKNWLNLGDFDGKRTLSL